MSHIDPDFLEVLGLGHPAMINASGSRKHNEEKDSAYLADKCSKLVDLTGPPKGYIKIEKAHGWETSAADYSQAENTEQENSRVAPSKSLSSE